MHCSLASIILSGICLFPFQGTGTAQPFGLRAFKDALELLGAPSEFRLEYRTTIISDETDHAARLRDFLREQAGIPRAFWVLQDLVAEIRGAEPVSDSSVRPSDQTVYIGGVTEYLMGIGRRHVFQQLNTKVRSLPTILQTPSVTLLYYEKYDRLEFHDTNGARDLRAPRAMLSPLPLSSLAKEHWLSREFIVDSVGTEELLLTATDESHVLRIKCSAYAPHLPVAAWVRLLGDADGGIQVGCFLSYIEVGGVLTPGRILSVRESGKKIRIDDYRLYEVRLATTTARSRIRITEDTRLVDKTSGRSLGLKSLSDVSPAWRDLIRLF